MSKSKTIAMVALLVLSVIVGGSTFALASDKDSHQEDISASTYGLYGVEEYEITNTDKGVEYASQATVRWRDKYDMTYDADDLKVYEFSGNDIVVVPTGAVLNRKAVELGDGSVKLEPVIMTASREQAEGSATGYSARDDWQLQAWTAFSRFYGDGSGWMDCVYQLWQLNESVGNADYFALKHYATAKSTGSDHLESAFVACVKDASSSSMSTVDWDPGADMDVGSCTSISLSVTVLGIGLGLSSQICEEWDITKGTPTSGAFENEWKGNADQEERDVAYEIAVQVPEDGWPVWTLSWGFQTD